MPLEHLRNVSRPATSHDLKSKYVPAPQYDAMALAYEHHAALSHAFLVRWARTNSSRRPPVLQLTGRMLACTESVHGGGAFADSGSRSVIPLVGWNIPPLSLQQAIPTLANEPSPWPPASCKQHQDLVVVPAVCVASTPVHCPVYAEHRPLTHVGPPSASNPPYQRA